MSRVMFFLVPLAWKILRANMHENNVICDLSKPVKGKPDTLRT